MALRRARWLLAATAVAGVVLGLWGSGKLVKPTFIARTAVLWEPAKDAKPSEVDEQLQTLMDTVKLPDHLAYVRETLSLPISLSALGSAIYVGGSEGSHLVVISATSKDRNQAAAIANTLVDHFVLQRKKLTEQSMREERAYLEERVAKARAALRALRADYDAFRKEHNVVELEAERDSVMKRIYDLEAGIRAARAEYEGETARAELYRGLMKGLPDEIILQENEQDPVASELGLVRSELVRARAELTDDHPTVRTLLDRERKLQSKLKKSGRRVRPMRTIGRNRAKDSLKDELVGAQASQQSARSREKMYGRLLQKAKARAKSLSAILGPAREKQAAIGGAEARLAELENELLVASEVDWTPDVQIRYRAEPPRQPAKSRRKIVAVAIPVLLFILVFSVVLLKPVIGCKAHTPSEVAFWGNSAVVASSSWPAAEDEIGHLRRDLSEQLSRSEGRVLVVPLTDRDRDCAYDLVGALCGGSVQEVGGDSESSGTAYQKSRKRKSPGRRGPRRKASNQVSKESAGRRATLELWSGNLVGPSVRRACRTADRVMVIARAGRASMFSLLALRERLGIEGNLACVVVGVAKDLSHLPDRAGDLEAFWVG